MSGTYETHSVVVYVCTCSLFSHRSTPLTKAALFRRVHHQHSARNVETRALNLASARNVEPYPWNLVSDRRGPLSRFSLGPWWPTGPDVIMATVSQSFLLLSKPTNTGDKLLRSTRLAGTRFPVPNCLLELSIATSEASLFSAWLTSWCSHVLSPDLALTIIADPLSNLWKESVLVSGGNGNNYARIICVPDI